MSLHFTPSQSDALPLGPARARTPIARAMTARAIRRVANDNDGPRASAAIVKSDKMLQAALRHFAQHGLRAAREAQAYAEAAFHKGDQAAYEWWLDITRILDRRLAIRTSRSHRKPHLEIG